MRASFFSVVALVALLLSVCVAWTSECTPSTPCEVYEAWEATYNSTGNMSDVGGAQGGGSMAGGNASSTGARNGTIPMPNYTSTSRVPSPSSTKQASSDARFTVEFTAKTTVASLVVLALILGA